MNTENSKRNTVRWMYKGGNLYYHLLEPLAAMAELIILKVPGSRGRNM